LVGIFLESASASGGLHPQASYRGFGVWTLLGDFGSPDPLTLNAPAKIFQRRPCSRRGCSKSVEILRYFCDDQNVQ